MEISAINLLTLPNIHFTGESKRVINGVETAELLPEVRTENAKTIAKIFKKGKKYEQTGQELLFTAKNEKRHCNYIAEELQKTVEEDGFLAGRDSKELVHLQKKYRVEDKANGIIREYIPKLATQERMGEGFANFAGVNDYILNEYNIDNDTLIRSSKFKRIPGKKGADGIPVSASYVLDSVKEYKDGELAKVIKLRDKDFSNKTSISLYAGKDDFLGRMCFDGDKLTEYIDGNARVIDNLIFRPATFYFNNGKLENVVHKETYYGFHMINHEEYMFENGKLAGYDDYKLSCRDSVETVKEYRVEDGSLKRTRFEKSVNKDF